MSGSGARGGSGTTWRAVMAAGPAPATARACGLGGPLDGPGADGDAGQAGQQGGSAGERHFCAGHWPAARVHSLPAAAADRTRPPVRHLMPATTRNWGVQSAHEPLVIVYTGDPSR